MKEQLIEEIERLRQEVDKLRQEKTERKRARERTQHLNLVLRGIRNVNQLIVREKDRSRLLKGICDSLTESHGYHNAWVALLDESGRLIAHAESGLGADFLPMKERLVRGELTHCAQKALKQSGLVITKNPTLNCSDCPLSAKYSGRGGMTIGLQRNGKSYGILCTSVPADLVEDEEECLFFQEVAGDIAFALHDLELEERHAQSEHDVKERVKELECLYGIAAIAEKSEITLDELYQEVANLLPSSWQYPEICCARITIEDKEFRTANYRDAKWKLCSDIKAGGVKAGAVEVNYLEERPELDEGPFLREERRLIDTAAEQMGKITEHKKAQAEIVTEKKKLESYIESMVDGVVLSDLKGTTVDINKACLELLGYKRKEDVVGRPGFIRAISKKDMPKIVTLLEGIIKKGYVKDREITVLAQDRKEIPILLSATLIKDPEGKPTSIFTIFKDITERKKAEETIEAERNKLQTQMEAMVDGVAITDVGGNFIQLNEAVAKMHGYKSAKELIGKPFSQLLSRKDIPRITKVFTETLKKKESVIRNFEVTLRRKDGSEYPAVTNIRNLFDEEGNLIYSVSVLRDITERKKAEEILRKSEERYKLLFESSEAGINLLDKDGNFLMVNKPAAETWGMSVENIVNKNIRDIMPPDMANEAMSIIHEIEETGTGRGQERYIKPLDKYFIEDVRPVLDSKGKFFGVQVLTYDITERKKAEEEIATEKKKFENYVEGMADGLCVNDTNGTITQVNEAFIRMFGYKSPEQVIGKTIFENIAQREIPRVTKKFTETVKNKESGIKDFEVICFRTDGSEFSVSFNIRNLWESKEYVGSISTARDITARKKAEERIKLFSDAVDGAYDSIILTDLNGNVTYANESTLKAFGYTQQEIMGLHVTSFTPDPKDAEKILVEVVQKGKWGGETIAVKKGKEKFPVTTSISLIKDANGELIGTMAVFRDITAQKKAEEELRESEERYRNLFETATDGIFTMDSQTRFTSGNRKAEEMCGYSRDELTGEYATLILPEEEIPRMADALKKVLRGETDTYETKIITKNGALIPVEVTSSPIEIDGKIIGTIGTARDITERKKAEQTLRESEEKYRRLTEEINDAIYATDRDGTLTYVSPVIEWLTGYSPSEITGRSIVEFLYEEDLPSAIEGFKRVLSGQSTQGEYRFHTKAGEIHWLGASTRAIFDGDRVVGTQGMLTDITKRKLAELASEEARTRFEDLFETANELIITTDTEGWILHVNKEVENFSGYSKKELIGQSILKIAYPEDTPKYIQFWKDILDGLTPRYHLRGFSKTGNISHLLASASVVKKDGNIVEIQYNAKDITVEKQAEEELRRSEEKYRTILENMTEGYYEVDIAGNFTFFNDTMCQIVGYTRDEMMGMNNRQYMDKENARKVYQMFNKVYTTGKPDRGFDWQFIKKDGTKRFVETSVSLMRNAEGKPTGFRGILRDTTDREEMEAERKMLEQRAQLTSRLSIVGEMASGIVHEINNPLTSVIGFAQLLAQQDLPEDTREYATIINKEGQRVATIAGRILDFARHQQPERVYADINHLIESTLELQAYEMESTNIKVTTQLDPHLPQTTADAGQLQQVFLNIILNARTEMQSAHGKGKFLVKTEAIDNTIRISFKDDGPGIAKENLEKIFEPFFTTKEVGTATGLGLSICHEIIANHNGQIYAESTLGKGATFTIELPVVARQRKTATTAGANASTVWQ